jgi:hypothetical protein
MTTLKTKENPVYVTFVFNPQFIKAVFYNFHEF